jgi:hypothetical protein
MQVQSTGSLVLALHYQNENCHHGRIKVGIGPGKEVWCSEVLAAAQLLERATASSIRVSRPPVV